MSSLAITCIALAILLMIALIGWGEMWKSKEYYRNRTFELSNGAEGSHLVKVEPLGMPPAPPPKKPAPERLMRPLLTKWIDLGNGQYIRKDYVTNLTRNHDGTINAVLVNGTSINTGMLIGEATKVLGIDHISTKADELIKFG